MWLLSVPAVIVPLVISAAVFVGVTFGVFGFLLLLLLVLVLFSALISCGALSGGVVASCVFLFL